jgi:hypothetical protein
VLVSEATPKALVGDLRLNVDDELCCMKGLLAGRRLRARPPVKCAKSAAHTQDAMDLYETIPRETNMWSTAPR